MGRWTPSTSETYQGGRQLFEDLGERKSDLVERQSVNEGDGRFWIRIGCGGYEEIKPLSGESDHDADSDVNTMKECSLLFLALFEYTDCGVTFLPFGG